MPAPKIQKERSRHYGNGITSHCTHSIVRNNFDAHRMRDVSGERYCYLWDPDGQKIEIREDMEAKRKAQES